MAGLGEAGVAALITAAAAVGTTAYTVSQQPGAPKMTKLPQVAQAKAPDTGALVGQRARQRAAALGRQSTIKTSPLGMVGQGGAIAGSGQSTILGG